jgi:hypothetical protein
MQRLVRMALSALLACLVTEVWAAEITKMERKQCRDDSSVLWRVWAGQSSPAHLHEQTWSQPVTWLHRGFDRCG